ncbi:hypothetical protein KIH27_09705 [Mycobacterium sp. M1]|uniref:PE-PGRS family protein n=1 Tax=Mycolicibacter acidiphilus TaxID=2835306 RepID=A0ABS5RJU8_9MYCO|nr:hypothetical protein [Mycolicibacter acidiphilus]MBS9533858.1 hypothetical protein [Mycolicibacter acidiphilus]
MSAGSGAKHRKKHAPRKVIQRGGAPRHAVPRAPRPGGDANLSLTAAALSAGVVVGTVTAVFGGPEAHAADESSGTVQQVALASIEAGPAAADPPATLDPFEQSLKFLLDSMGIGEKTPVQLFTPGGLTVGELLNGSSGGGVTVDTGFHISDTLNLLGLQNITIGEVMTALSMPPADTVDQVLSTMQFLNTKLDMVLHPLGLMSTQTLLGVEEQFGVANITVDQLLSILGFAGNETLGTVWNFWGLPSGFISLINTGLGLGCSGLSNSSTIDTAIQCITGISGLPGGKLSGSETLGEVLQADKMPDGRPLADYTLGEALGFNTSTTIRQFVDNLHLNLSGEPVGPGETVGSLNDLPTLGSTTIGSLMGWANMSPTESLATLIDNFQVGGVSLGSYTIGDALDHLILNPSALSTSGVEDSTLVSDFLNAMGWGTYTIDQMLNLSP